MSSLTPDPSPADAPRTPAPPRERGEPRSLRRSRRGPRPSSDIRDAARDLRQRQTRSEELLWRAIRGRQLGHKFRRQHPVGRFVLDFYCDEQRLAIEVDGPIHDASPGADAERDATLNSYGIRVVRIPSSLVETDLQSALRLIMQAFTRHPRARRSRPQPRSPAVGKRRGRGPGGRGAGGEGL